MILVSLVAVGAFDAVGSILVIAFFIIPPAAAYLLTDRLSLMLLAGPLIGAAGAVFGYDLARGQLFGVIPLSDGIAAINRLFGLDLTERWDSSISASMVLMIFIFFCWPGYSRRATACLRPCSGAPTAGGVSPIRLCWRISTTISTRRCTRLNAAWTRCIGIFAGGRAGWGG